MNEHDIFLEIREFASNNSEKNDIHGFSHVERVYDMCVEIGKKLEANMVVLKLSALLHDVGRIKEMMGENGKNHAEISAEMAVDLLNVN